MFSKKRKIFNHEWTRMHTNRGEESLLTADYAENADFLTGDKGGNGERPGMNVLDDWMDA
jgi:hypothetical protein